jgi:hypothetical protein
MMLSFEQIIFVTNQTTVGNTRVVFDDGSEFYSMLSIDIFVDLWLRSMNINLKTNQQFVRKYLPKGYKLPIMLSALHQQSLIVLANHRVKELSYVAAHRLVKARSHGADITRIVFDNFKFYDFGVDIRSVKHLLSRNDEFWKNYLKERHQLINNSKLNQMIISHEGVVVNEIQ